MNQQKGNGVKEVVDKVITVAKNVIDALKNGIRKHGNPAFRKMVEKYGNKKILELTLQRKPIDAQYKKILNVLTSGKLNKTVQDLTYDDIFHLAVILKMEGGEQLKFEKNHVVEISPIQQVHGDLMPVKVSTPILLNDFIGMTMTTLGPEKYVLYDSITDNCQRFIDAHLTANGLNSPAYKKFVVQDAYQLIQKDPVIQNLEKGN